MKGAHNPDARRRLIAAVHAEAKRRGMDEETRRDLIHRETGKVSAAELTNAELGKVLTAIKGGGTRRAAARGRAMADSPHARKIRALWLSLWELGAVDSPAESAIAAFAARQLGVEALQWVSPADASAIIEALRAIGRRHGWDVKPGVNRAAAEIALYKAQAERLVQLAGSEVLATLELEIVSYDTPLSALIRRLGEAIRQHLGGARG